MAKFIQIPTSAAGSPNILFNTDNVTSVLYLTTTTFAIYGQSKTFTFTTGTAGAAGAVTSIYNAILATNGPTLVNVILTGTSVISALPVVS